VKHDFPVFLRNGRYRVERIFADGGGMGLLYEARDTFCADNRVLIKTTRYDTGPRTRNFKYTRDEAEKFVESSRKILAWEKKVLVRFRNDGLNNIPSANNYFLDRSLTLQPAYEGKAGTYELGEETLDREPYLVLEYIPGDLLDARFEDEAFRGDLEDNLLTLAREILTIFIRLHRSFELDGQEAYFLYQDLKPGNVLVSQEDYFTLIDFGGVTLRLGGKTTEPTAGCITAGYAAPEASGGNEAYIDARYDIFTLGATLWEAVTGVEPASLGEFPTLDPAAMRGRGVSEGFVKLVARAVHPDVDKRYPSAAAMRRDVMELLREVRAPQSSVG